MVPFRLIGNEACCCIVLAENTPTVGVPSRTANLVPSGESARGGASGETAPQQGDPAPSWNRRPKLRSPFRSHLSRTPPSEDVYSVVESGLNATSCTCSVGAVRTRVAVAL